MLVGSDDFIKADRMIHRFIIAALGHDLSDDDCQRAITGVQRLLANDYPVLTPKSLDHLIWQFQRNQ